MRRMARLSVMVLALGLFLPILQAEEVYPDLAVAEWSQKVAVTLEDFKGQPTALIFYDDDDS